MPGLSESYHEAHEDQSAAVTCTVLDENDAAVALAAMDSIKMTLYAVDSNEVINSRSAQDVKNTNNCTYHATSGLFTWTMQTADNDIKDTKVDAADPERHRAVVRFVFSTTKAFTHTFIIDVFRIKRQPV
jgi:hypothetical protein